MFFKILIVILFKMHVAYLVKTLIVTLSKKRTNKLLSLFKKLFYPKYCCNLQGFKTKPDWPV